MQLEKLPLLLSIKRASELTGLSRDALRQHFPATVKLGGKHYYHAAQLVEQVSALPATGAPEDLLTAKEYANRFAEACPVPPEFLEL